MMQKNLSPHQVRWLEVLSDFDFTIEHIPGDTNVLTDALSRIYSSDFPGTVQANSEFMSSDSTDSIPLAVTQILDEFSCPVITDLHAIAVSISPTGLITYPLYTMVSNLDKTAQAANNELPTSLDDTRLPDQEGRTTTAVPGKPQTHKVRLIVCDPADWTHERANIPPETTTTATNTVPNRPRRLPSPNWNDGLQL